MEAAMVLTPTGPPPIFLQHRHHDLLIDLVQAEAIHFQQIERGLRHAQSDVSFGANLRIIANAPQQAVGDARRAAAAAGDLFARRRGSIGTSSSRAERARWRSAPRRRKD